MYGDFARAHNMHKRGELAVPKGKQEGSWHLVVVWFAWVTMGGWPLREGFNLAVV